jgi:hypothetical protein
MSNFDVEFDEWKNHPMTCKVMDYLNSEREKYNSIDKSVVLECSVSGNKMASIEKLGMDSFKRASIIEGIDKFANVENLRTDMKEA